MGFCYYYNGFIKNYLRIIDPLTKLLLKDTVFEWGSLQPSAFEELLHALTSAPFLLMPCFDKPFTILVDTSDVTISAVLALKVDYIDMPVCCHSKQLNETKARWSIYEHKLYAIVLALSKL